MAKSKSRWSYSAGEKNRNRVRAFEHSSGILMLEFYERGGRKRLSLGHRDRERAKQQADEAATKLGKRDSLRPAERTLRELFEMYLGEVSPKNGPRHRKYDQKAARMFIRYFGVNRKASTLSRRDWDRFIQDRGAGRIGVGSGRWKPVRKRTVQKDLSFLRSVLRWATMAGDGQGGVLLGRDPLKEYDLPREKNPRRITVTDEEYRLILGVAHDIDWRFRVALIVAHETGHRIGAIHQLKWSDLDLEGRRIQWRAETEKTGYAHTTPMTEDARLAFEEARSHAPGIGDTFVLPAPKDSSRPVDRYVLRNWWRRAEVRAGLGRMKGRGYHSLRRKFATELSDVPLKVLCELGGWRDIETVIKCYQQPDEDALRVALEDRRARHCGARTDTTTDTHPVSGLNEKPRLMS